jgi:hypothetical protein
MFWWVMFCRVEAASSTLELQRQEMHERRVTGTVSTSDDVDSRHQLLMSAAVAQIYEHEVDPADCF